MNLKRTSSVSRLLTTNGSADHIQAAAGSPFLVGQTVNLTSSGGPSNAGLQISDIKGVAGGTDVALYLIDPGNGQPFNATGYTTAQSATVTAPVQTLWYAVGTDDEAPTDIFSDLQMNAILAAILPAAASLAANVAVTNFPATQPVSIVSSPLPTNAATESTLNGILTKLNASVAVTGTFWQATQPVSAASLPLPTGAATETTLAALSAKFGSLGQQVMAASAPVVIASNQSAVPVSAASLPLPTGASTAANQASILAALAGTLTVSASGTVNVGNFPATQPVSAASLPLPVGASTAAHQTDGTQVTQVSSLPALATGSNTIGKVDQGVAGASAWKVDGSAITQPVSAASLPLPTGAATETTLASILSKLNASVSVTGSVGITNFPATQAVSAASLPLPTGASTEATLSSILTKLNASVAVTGTVAVSNFPAIQPISAVALPLPTGAATDTTVAAVTTAVNSMSGKFDNLTRDPLITDSGIVTRPLEPAARVTSFGELLTAEKYPQVLLSFAYAINPFFVNKTELNGGTVTQSGGFAVLTTSTATNSSAILESRAASQYVPGTGVLTSFSALYATGTAGCFQGVGLFDSSEGVGIGYNGGTFSVFTKSGASYTFAAQSTWTVDKMDGSGPSGVTLVPQNLNLYRIQFGWHGAADVQFFIYAKGSWVLVHVIEIANFSATPLFLTPNFPLRAEITKTSGATGLILKTLSMGCYAEGNSLSVTPEGAPISVTSGTKSVSTAVAMLTLQNLTTVFSGKTNRVRTHVHGLKATSLGGQAMIIRLILNTTLGGTPVFNAFDATTSVSAFDVAGTTTTGGRVVWQGSVGPNSSENIDLQDAEIFLNPGDTLTAEYTSGGGATNAVASINAVEHFFG